MLDHAEFDAAAQRLAGGLTYLNNMLVAQAAMGWVYRDNADRAREALVKLSPDGLRKVTVAAAALAALAAEQLAAATQVDAG